MAALMMAGPEIGMNPVFKRQVKGQLFKGNAEREYEGVSLNSTNNSASSTKSEPRMDPYSKRQVNERPFKGNGERENEGVCMDSVKAVSTKSEPRMVPYFQRQVNGPPFRGNEEMQYECVRLNTFKDWPNWAAVWPTLLARAGFYYTKTADQVACFCCSGRLKTWEAGDSPLTEHKPFFPQCRFMTGRDSTNVPLGEAPEVEAREVPSSGQSSRTQTKSKYYVQRAKHAAAINSQPVKVLGRPAAGLDQQSGPTSLGNSATTVQKSQYASLQYSTTNEALSSSRRGGLSMATGGATGILSLSLQQLQDMKLESKRLESFTNWPTIAYVRPENLSKAGLYYLGIADRVKCAFCNGILRNWVAGDDPMEVHLKYFPKCAFLKDTWAAGNVSIEEEKVNIQQASQNAVANPSPSSQLGVVPPEEPRSLNYSGETSRLSSFRRWPQNLNQSKEDLAQAGFYYTGIEDSVKCFSCIGTVRNWERGDDPWTEHARWFPRCNYVRTVKGEAFIRTIQSAYSGQTRGETVANSAANVTQSANTGARRFSVEARVIRARMDTSRVRSVLDMGFPRDLVYKVIENHLTTTGDDFPNVQSLMEAVFAEEEAAPSSSSPARSTATMSTAPPAAAATCNGGGAETTACNRTATTAAETTSSTSTTAACNGATTAAATENQAAASANTTKKGKTQKKRKKNKSATGSSGTKPSPSVEMKSEVRPATSEHQRLLCKICMDDEAKILFLPCGHLCSCAKCAPALRNCPICRALIRGTVRVYLS